MSKNFFWKVNITCQWEYEYLARPGGDAELPEHIPSTHPSPFDLWLWSLVWGNTVFQTTLRERLPHWATSVTPWTPNLLYPTAFMPSATPLRFHCSLHSAEDYICFDIIIIFRGVSTSCKLQATMPVVGGLQLQLLSTLWHSRAHTLPV